MKKIPVTEITDGMVLAQAVTGSNGNVLIGQGTVLKSSMSGRLSGWGVPSVFVESEDSQTEAPVTQPSSALARESLDNIFKGRLANSAMRAIYKAILKHRGFDDAAS